jgi:probable phosphoglycerate mutase
VKSLPGTTLTAHIDGGARGNPGNAGYGVHLTLPDDGPVDEVYGFLGVATNNVAEYAALVAALEYAIRAGVRSLHVHSDSQLLVRQIQGSYRVKNKGLQVMFRQARQRIAKLESFRIEHVFREENKEADRLANRAMDEEGGSGHFAPEEILGAPETLF